MPKKFEPPILKALDELYERQRRKLKALYPCNKKTNTIQLPDDVIADLKFFLLIASIFGVTVNKKRRATDNRHCPSRNRRFQTYGATVSILPYIFSLRLPVLFDAGPAAGSRSHGVTSRLSAQATYTIWLVPSQRASSSL